MPDVQEVYEMVTKQKPPQPGALERQQKRQVRTARNRKIGAIIVAAAIGLVTIALVLATRPTGQAVPADDSSQAFTPPPAEGPADAAAIKVATHFLDAYRAYDAKQASTYLADNADIMNLTNGVGGSEGLSLMTAWLRATGSEMILDPCESSTSASASYVTCAFDFHELRSDEIGRGPFTGSDFTFTVREGEIVTGSLNWDTTKFSPQMWEPFEEWVSTTHPKDAAVMYTDGTHSNFRLTRASIQLWGERTREYVQEIQATPGQ